MSFLIVLFVPRFFPVNGQRANRHCHEPGHPILPEEDSQVNVCLVLVFGILFLLIFLGILKGLVGLCCSRSVGMYGLNLLIDLPQPLSRYQEKGLGRRPVVYDIGGWPVHPDTQERTVRVLPKRTEFCLNLIFFLACPLAVSVYICALFCCIRNLNKSQENTCFKHVDVVRMVASGDNKNVTTLEINETDGADVPADEPKNGKDNDGEKGPEVDVYKEDVKEEQDTKYVLETMQKSKESIHEYRVNLRLCSCHDEKMCACGEDSN